MASEYGGLSRFCYRVGWRYWAKDSLCGQPLADRGCYMKALDRGVGMPLINLHRDTC